MFCLKNTPGPQPTVGGFLAPNWSYLKMTIGSEKTSLLAYKVPGTRSGRSREKRDKYTVGRVMTGRNGEKTLREKRSEQKGRSSETERQRGGMMYLTLSVGFLLNKLLPQILGACVDKFGLIKVTEMPACLHTSIKRWYICHSQWKSTKGF